MTPPAVAQLMASMLLQAPPDEVHLLDPGAGVGSLTAAAVRALLSRSSPPQSIRVVTYEIEALLVGYLEQTLNLCRTACEARGVAFEASVEATDFLSSAEHQVSLNAGARFNAAILNPPYRKIQSSSDERGICRALGLEVSNLYAAFLGATIRLLEPGAELVSITPRSFANGVYFRAFRGFLLSQMALRRLHVFESRQHAFREDDVLQENLIMHAVKDHSRPAGVEITVSDTPDDPVRSRSVPWSRVVYPRDREQFIHLIVDEKSDAAAEQLGRFGRHLKDLGLAVSTGPVVDFRATQYLRAEPDATTVPLLYPGHLNGGTVHWPKQRGSKPNALILVDESHSLTLPNEIYVLVKRFTSKEERRRVVAAAWEPNAGDTERVAFENHLNFFHDAGHGLPLELARGLTLYLNSTLVDSYFRLFSGHTQVNAVDLRNMPYPTRIQLEEAGRSVSATDLPQDEVDRLVEHFMLS
jgi:adenine-specific DNA-methyltransferase